MRAIKLGRSGTLRNAEWYIRLSLLQYSSGTRQPTLVTSVVSVRSTGEDEIRLKKRNERVMSFFIAGSIVSL